MVYQAEKTLKEHGDKVPAEQRSDLEQKIEALRQATKGGDAGTLRNAMDGVNQSLQQVGQHIYSQAGAGQPGPDEGEPAAATGEKSGEEGNVVDADYREVN